MKTKVSEYWKVPFRQVYCDTFLSCLAQTIYCHVVLRLQPHKLPSMKEGAPS